MEDPLRLRSLRKDVARLKTVLRERELGGETAGTAGNGTAGSTGARR